MKDTSSISQDETVKELLHKFQTQKADITLVC
jgi:hypothetical protein